MSKSTTKKKVSRTRAPAKSPLDIKRKIEAALRAEFPIDTVDVSDGYKDNVHILVVSRRFDGMHEYERHEMLRQIIKGAGLTKAQIGKISLVLAWSPGEIK